MSDNNRKYDFDNFDEEETIERVECGIDSLDIFATTDELSRWKIGDLISIAITSPYLFDMVNGRSILNYEEN